MTAYAVAVLNGEIIAGPHVRAACERHLADLEHGEARGLVFDRTAAEDFFGFCEEVCTVLVDSETTPFVLTPAQRFITGSIFGWKRTNGRRRFRTCYVEQGKGNGKTPLAAAVGMYGLVADGEERSEVYAAAPLALDTPVPTPRGWTTQGDLRVGDSVFDEAGRPCRVTYLSPVLEARPCFEVEFDDGTVIVSDANHRWLTEDTRGQKPGMYPQAVVTTAQIAASLRAPTGRLRHRIPIGAPLVLPPLALPIDPYTLGAWLGDGRSNRGTICFSEGDRSTLREFERAGYTVSEQGKGAGQTRYATILGLRTQLREAGLLDNKHVPMPYLRGSGAQRLAILQGLMDTDGTCTKEGECRFTNREKRLADAVLDLAIGLGLRAHLRSVVVTGSPHWMVNFRAPKNIPVFRLQRKTARQIEAVGARAGARYIRDVRPCSSVPVRCVEVSSKSHLYLVSRANIATHNTKKDQAMILFRDAVSMVNNSPELATNIVKSGGNPVWQLTYHPTASFFKPIANDDGQSGPRPHFGLVDELHEVKDAYTIKMLAAGFKARTQPLLFLITNSGFDRTTICWEYHEHAIKVAAQEIEDDSFFAAVFSLDDGDDPFTDETCWVKTNPELGVVIKDEYLRSRVQTAMMLPSDQNEVLRLNFCVWTDADRAWITTHAWERCESRPAHRKRDLVLEDFKGAKAHGGLDLSFSQDLTARALVFRDSHAGKIQLYGFLKFWTPAKTLIERERRDRVPYSQWVRDGWMEATPGPVIPMAAVGRQLQQDAKDFDISFFAYDRYRHKDLTERMAEAGFDPPMIEHPQGFRRASRLTHDEAARFGYYDERGEPAENPLWMPGSIEELEVAIVEGRFWTPKHPVLRWNVASVMPRDDPAGTGNKVFDKRKATGRIDGAVALAMAAGAAMARFNSAEGALDDFLRNPVMVT